MRSSSQPQTKRSVRYEDLRKKGMSKERAARIANSQATARDGGHINNEEEGK